MTGLLTRVEGVDAGWTVQMVVDAVVDADQAWGVRTAEWRLFRSPVFPLNPMSTLHQPRIGPNTALEISGPFTMFINFGEAMQWTEIVSRATPIKNLL